MTLKRNHIDMARDALNELYGLVPTDERGSTADESVRIVEQALYGYAQALGSLREIENKLFHATKETALVADRITSIFEGSK